MSNDNVTNKYVSFSKVPFIKRLLNHPVPGLMVHWLFQGMTYMDPLERTFKIGFDVIFTLMIVAVLLICNLPVVAVWILAWLLSHTLNFFLNGQIWVVLKHYGFVDTPRKRFDQYVAGLTERIQSCTCIEYAALYGSIARSQWKPSSDLDVRLVHKRGLINGLYSCLFVFSERRRALFERFPLDIYVLDGYKSMNQKKVKEEPVILKQA